MEHFALKLLSYVSLGLLVYFVISHGLVALWYWHFCRVAQRKIRVLEAVPVILIAPLYGMVPLTITALIAAWLCEEPGYYQKYCYYLVAVVFNRKRAADLYGEHKIFPKQRFVRLAQLLRK